MNRLRTCGAAFAAALGLAACGGSDSDNSSEATAPSKSATTVAAKQFDDVGSVLVDRGGQALYTSDQEADGKVRCTGGCTSFWKPLKLDAGKPSAAAGVGGTLGVVSRPDGEKQVTHRGKPLYTFTEDAQGKVTGDGFTDAFAGRDFKWEVVGARGKPASSGSGSDDSSGAGSGY